MSKRPLFLIVSFIGLLLIFSGIVYAPETQKAWLRMYASGSTYVQDDPDPWVSWSYVVSSSATSSISLTMDVNKTIGAADNDVYEIVLLIATNNTSPIASISVDNNPVSLAWSYFPGEPFNGPPMYSDPGPVGGDPLGALPPHGVYNDPAAAWVEYRSGLDLPSGNTKITFSVKIDFTSSNPGKVKIHFDTYGWTPDSSQPSGISSVIIDDTKDAVFAPFSSDITLLVPEFSIGLIATVLGFGGYLLVKRKLRA